MTSKAIHFHALQTQGQRVCVGGDCSLNRDQPAVCVMSVFPEAMVTRYMVSCVRGLGGHCNIAFQYTEVGFQCEYLLHVQFQYLYFVSPNRRDTFHI